MEIALRATPVLAGKVKLAVLFGSWATATPRPDSDVDIAFVPAGPMALAEELSLQAALQETLGCTVDLVRLDRASTLLRWEVATQGVPLVTDPTATWNRFRAEAASEHADLEPALRAAAQLLRRRLAGGKR